MDNAISGVIFITVAFVLAYGSYVTGKFNSRKINRK